jgi:hypothetical protein
VAHTPLIPRRALIVSGAFGPRLGARAVAHAIARGLVEGGAEEPAVAELGDVASLGATRAVILAPAELSLAHSAALELATRARQGGVPAYAITAHNHLSSFDARVLDLQLVLQARGARSLASAGRRIAEVL